jgi:pimeloyl-ACP methyl ester carboxylesterase
MRHSVQATVDEQRRQLPGDELIAEPPTLSMTHAITIRRPPCDVWPWIAQMGAGNRAGWYSYDFLDNRRHRSAVQILPELQHLDVGMVFPALPGETDGFTLVAFERERFLILDFKGPDRVRLVTWVFQLEPLDDDSTRLVVRARGSSGAIGHRILPLVHFIMQRKQLLGIAQRAEAVNPFKTSHGKAAFLTAYDAAMKLWPVPHKELDISGRFGSTHVIVSGPENAPPLVLLHGYMATSTMWLPNVADFVKEYRIYAVDVMGQPGKSVPGEPIRAAADYVTWLTETLNALHLDRVALAGVSYGGWLALAYALAAPQRVRRLVLLSAGGLLPLARQFTMRGMLMVFLPTRFTVNWVMGWLGIDERSGGGASRNVGDFLRLIYLGLKHFRMPPETVRVVPSAFTDAELRVLQVPTLVLYGDHEVICDPAGALERARRLIPDVDGDLIPGCSHDMCASQYRVVDARVLGFLRETRPEHATITERSVA